MIGLARREESLCTTLRRRRAKRGAGGPAAVAGLGAGRGRGQAVSGPVLVLICSAKVTPTDTPSGELKITEIIGVSEPADLEKRRLQLGGENTVSMGPAELVRRSMLRPRSSCRSAASPRNDMLGGLAAPMGSDGDEHVPPSQQQQRSPQTRPVKSCTAISVILT